MKQFQGFPPIQTGILPARAARRLVTAVAHRVVVAVTAALFLLVAHDARAACSATATVTTHPERGLGLEVTATGGSIGTGFRLTLFNGGRISREMSKGAVGGSVTEFYGFGCGLEGSGIWTWKVTASCTDPLSPADPDRPDATTTTSSTFEGGPYDATWVFPTLNATLLAPPTPEANVKVEWFFPPTVGTRRSINIDEGRNGGVPSSADLQGEQTFNLPPGKYVIVQKWCFGASGQGPFNQQVLTVPATPPPDPGTFAFDLASSDDVKVLIHKYRDETTYPSPLQTEDHQIRVEGTLTDRSGRPMAGKTVYFRVIDPPDVAPYVPQGDRAAGDNADASAGSLNSGGRTVSALTDGSGRVALVLHTTDHVAGDNYQVEASTTAAFSCGAAGCAKSATYTAWKRVYYETAKMFRRGSHVALDRPTNVDETEIWVDDITPFQSGQVVRLIHAPRYQQAPQQSTGPFATLDPLESFYEEDHLIDVVPASTDAQGHAVPAHLQLRTNDVLLHTYGADRSFAGAVGPAIKYFADFVGPVGSNRDFFEADGSLLTGLYQDAFVEYVPAATPVPEIPYEPVLQMGWWSSLSKKWFFNAVRAGAGVGNGSAQAALPNHQHLLGAAETIGGQTTLPNGQRGVVTRFGETNVADGSNFSWVFRGRIERAVTEPTQPIFHLSADVAVAEVSAHELTHQWRTNAALPGEHCGEDRYQRDGRWCLMHTPAPPGDVHGRGMADGLAAFHYVRGTSGTVNSEYVTIRDAAEPVPQR